MENESAIIIPIPEVEPIVGALRLQYDPAARLGVPAHITLLYPFFSAQAVDDEIEPLRDVCASIPSFSFSFTDVRNFPATAYLHPDDTETFVQIIATLMSTWPACEPYGGAFRDIIPHLTVADHVDIGILTAVADSLRRRLPIHCVAREICLLISDAGGMWSRKAAFPLATPKTS